MKKNDPAAHPPYTTEFCEREYNARAAIADHPQIFARWAQAAAATRRQHACLLDLPYGETPAERLDLFPTGAARAPLLVFVHGGYWRSLDKSDFSWIAPPFVAHGVAVALPNYGLAPAVAIEDIVRQTLAMLAWLYRRAEDFGVDRNRIFVAGHSAGAHLAAMMAAALWPQYAPDLPARLVRGALLVSGVFDLEPLAHAPFVNVDLKLDVERARRLSPVYLPPATDAPVLVAVGAEESSEFRRQSALLAARWSRNVLRSIEVEGRNHLTVCDALADADSPLFTAALEFVRRA
ncbi:MAG TPA: alpha/beta hydrolase [Burkholderiaceae bacterium]|nr:alpha/beta hydrolase [Burkholderiaceae bacterium]